jgi:hypothetical protein
MAEVMRRPFRYRRRRLISSLLGASVAVGTTVIAAPLALADTSPYPNPPFPSCLPEQFPHAGAARGTTSTPYEIPFSATLGQPSVSNPNGPLQYGGYLQIANSLVTATLGGPVVPAVAGVSPEHGAIFAHACGLVQLPSQAGGISGNPYGNAGNGNADQYNNNFVFENPIPISLGITGIPLPVLHAYGSADGELLAKIDHTPAANGGLNVEFDSSAKATSDLGPILAMLTAPLGPGVTLPGPVASILNGVTGSLSTTTGNECTIPIGNLVKAGIPAGDLTTATGLDSQQATAPAVLTTQTSGGRTGQPVTGPITNSFATLVGNDFPVAAIDPNTPPSPDAPGAGTTKPSALCSPTNAQLFNSLLGLPSPAGKNTFYAPGTFAIHTSQ